MFQRFFNNNINKIFKNCKMDYRYLKNLRNNFSFYVKNHSEEEHKKNMNRIIRRRNKFEKLSHMYSLSDLNSSEDYFLYKMIRIINFDLHIINKTINVLKKYNEEKEIENIVEKFTLPDLNYCEIMDKIVLPYLNIKTINDIDKIVLNKDRNIPMIKDIEGIRVQLYAAFSKQEVILKELLKADNQCFFYYHLTNSYIDYLPFMSCILPQRYIVTPNDIVIAKEFGIEGSNQTFKQCINTGTDFIYQYFQYNELFRHELITILPQMLTVDPTNKYGSIFSLKPYNKNGNIIINNAFGYNNPIKDNSMLFASFDWIKNVHVEEYLELADKYKSEYNRFQIKLDELLLKTKKEEHLPSIIIKEYNEASLEIKNIISKKKNDMKRIGKQAIMGTLLTVLPIAMEINGFNYFDPKYISSAVGGATIFNCYKEFDNLKKSERQNPFWILWKWQQNINSRT